MKRLLLLLLILSLPLSSLVGCRWLNEHFGIHPGVKDARLVDFWDILYIRPDDAKLSRQIENVTIALRQGLYSDADALCQAMQQLVEAFYYDFQTMESLAFIRYAGDITNDSLREEYYSLLAASDRLYAEMEQLYALCAESPHRDALEQTVLGEGFLDSYEGDFTLPEELRRLFERESELLSSYGEAMASPSVVYDGKTYTSEAITAISDPELYDAVTDAFYQTHNRTIGALFLELVEIRNQIAAFYGCSNYAEYAYISLYDREYSPDEAEAYLLGIRDFLTPVYRRYFGNDDFSWYDAAPSLSPKGALQKGKALVASMSEELGYIYEEMMTNHLYTAAASDSMYYGSFATYFNDYETPYLFVNGDGTILDVQAYVHEFGHFASSYYNYGMVGSNDESEVASQGLELLSTRYLDRVFSPEESALIRRVALHYMISSFQEGAAYTAFENLVYADKSLTLEECNDYYRQCAEDFGLLSESDSSIASLDWVFVHHLIEYPYYMIGYAVSADVAVQLYELDIEEEGRGVEAYLDLIALAHQYDFFGNLSTVGLSHPFATGRSEEVAIFFDRELAEVTP